MSIFTSGTASARVFLPGTFGAAQRAYGLAYGASLYGRQVYGGVLYGGTGGVYGAGLYGAGLYGSPAARSASSTVQFFSADASNRHFESHAGTLRSFAANSPQPGGLGRNVEVTANIWVDPVNGNDSSPSSKRSATLIPYSSAQPLATVHVANSTSQAGDVVAFMPGVYSNVNNSAGGREYLTTSASKGSGNDVNPNTLEQGSGAPASPDSGWVRWIPGVVNAPRDSIQLVPYLYPRLTIVADMHLIIDGSTAPNAFFIPALNFGWPSDSTCKNIQTYDIHVQGVAARGGAQNIRMVRTEAGPFVLGTQAQLLGSGSPIGSYEEAYKVRSNGTGDLDEFQPPKIQNSSRNIRFEHLWVHDCQSRDNNQFHTGAGWINNGSTTNGLTGDGILVFDNMMSERVTTQGFFIEGNTDGVVVQNSWFGTPTLPLDQSAAWATPAPAQGSFKIKRNPASGWVPANYLIRYNDFQTDVQIESGFSGTFSNYRFIGNTFGGAGGAYVSQGAVYDYNAFTSAGFGTHFVNLGSFPIVNGNAGTTYSATSQVDFHLSSGTKANEGWVPNLGSDYVLALDMDGQTRNFPNTAGPDQRT